MDFQNPSLKTNEFDRTYQIDPNDGTVSTFALRKITLAFVAEKSSISIVVIVN